MRELKDGIRSIVKLDYTGKVHKTFRGTDREERFAREVEVLKVLEERGCDYVPKLLEAHPEELRIVTTNCGAPADLLSEEKANSLFRDLEHDFGVIHDDPFPRNVTYSSKLGRFCIIDFELATIVEQSTTDQPTEANTWRVTWSALSTKGSTHVANDDAFTICSVGDARARKRSERGQHFLDPDHLMLLVSDGMGGKNAGELASRLITAYARKNADALFERLSSAPDDLSPLQELFEKCHEGLVELAANDPQIKGMGATATLGWITPGQLHFAHAGDTRIHLHRDGHTTQLTSDHSFAWSEWKTQGYSEYQYRSHPRLSVIYECLGGRGGSIHPQLDSFELKRGDLLLFSTDGITDGLWDDHIHQEMSAGGSIDEIAERISSRAIKNCGKDDTTLIAARIE